MAALSANRRKIRRVSYPLGASLCCTTDALKSDPGFEMNRREAILGFDLRPPRYAFAAASLPRGVRFNFSPCNAPTTPCGMKMMQSTSRMP